ncbi:hypothetical protein GTO89_03255 [Heliobacterium gestii]|uniref:Putative amidase domain-containing protein n=1 Tax=Heliomicrobium gestii TaxID=2699 RepID=A0A845L603_HELGE|nr:amidase domain-containing protein [Heliomicrobium gestii]MBM7865810.1 hypothetical protein [Heliomicrobium gestii]MZP42052.1 hypothetical protein [Heliomicrobium gestii]
MLKKIFSLCSILIIFCFSYPAYAINGESAARYADQWATSCNTAWPSYTQDCTNFVSQALYAGGMPMDKTTPNVWFMEKETLYGWNNSKSWTVSTDLRNYLLSTGKATQIGGWGWVNYLTIPSDSNSSFVLSTSKTTVFFYDFGNGLGVSHAAIQTWSGTDNYYSSYTGNRADYHSKDKLGVIWHLRPHNTDWQRLLSLHIKLIKEGSG